MPQYKWKIMVAGLSHLLYSLHFGEPNAHIFKFCIVSLGIKNTQEVHKNSTYLYSLSYLN